MSVGVVVVIGCATALIVAAIADNAHSRFLKWVRLFAGRVLTVYERNIHSEKEAEPVRCLACKRPAMLLFNDNDVLCVVCRDAKHCGHVEVV
jgi:hypothetical protein